MIEHSHPQLICFTFSFGNIFMIFAGKGKLPPAFFVLNYPLPLYPKANSSLFLPGIKQSQQPCHPRAATDYASFVRAAINLVWEKLLTDKLFFNFHGKVQLLPRFLAGYFKALGNILERNCTQLWMHNCVRLWFPELSSILSNFSLMSLDCA